MLPADPSLRRRIVAASLLVVVLPFAFIYGFVFAINHVLLPLLEALDYGPYYGRVYVEPWLAVVVVLGGLVAQALFGPRTVLSSVGAREVDVDEYPELHAAVARLAQQADHPKPTVTVTRNSAPNAMAVAGPRTEAIVVTTGLLETLDGEELDAVLAHELAHLANDDATVMTVAWLLPTVTYYVAMAAYYVLYGIFHLMGRSRSDSDGDGAAKAVVVLVVAAVVTLALSAMFWAASVLVHRVLSRYREYAADRGAAAITGNPAALASALRTMDETMPEVPDRDLRELDGGAEALYAAPLEHRAFGDADLVSTDVFPETHPPTAKRIEKLQAMAEEL
ncbi:M48 family metalloprotease [Halorarius litoreus]|uniref:M48 family metalloprotease n=1 Tax=Halorarius litoreus TaxID=2962676 RepID=UPI0020CD7155|nr:M48 family metalloprotease [Halorarius litoreus]